MTKELLQEIVGHLVAFGIVGWAAYLNINGQPVPDYLFAAFWAVIGMYFPGAAAGVRARVYKWFGACR
jgi:hypothetical protein